MENLPKFFSLDVMTNIVYNIDVLWMPEAVNLILRRKKKSLEVHFSKMHYGMVLIKVCRI